MRIIIDIGHPDHVHSYKNFIWEMRKRGHHILITAGQKDVTLELLKAYRFDYIFTCRRHSGLPGLAFELLKRDIQMFRLARRFKPDVITGIHSTIAAHISRVTKAKSIIFTDSEPRNTKLASMVTFPFADVICTPDSFNEELGKKQVRYNGYHELAYLHPKRFTADPQVLKGIGLKVDDRFVILRFVAWKASHDIGQYGFSLDEKRLLVKELEQHARVFISSENPLPEEFDSYRITLPPDKLHHLLYYADLCVSEGATTATEAGILGTPSMLVSSLVIKGAFGNFDELGERYGLVRSFSKPDEAIKEARNLLTNRKAKLEWREYREKLLEEKIDVTGFMIELFEEYINRNVI